MSNKTIIIVIAFILFTFMNCVENSTEANQQVKPPVSIDISNSEDIQEKISYRDLLTDVSYIELETDSFFLTEVKKILEFNDTLLILDKNKQLLVAYNMEGKFLGQIGNKGIGPQEYKLVTDFDIDYSSGKIIVFSRPDLSFLIYDKNFNFMKKVRIGLWAFQFSILPNGRLAFYQSFGDDKNNIKIFDIEGKKVSERMPYPLKGGYVAMDYSGFMRGAYYTYPLSGKIYKITDDNSSSLEAFDIKIPKMRPESEKFQQTKFLEPNNFMRTHILTNFSVGENEELIFSYSSPSGTNFNFPVGIRLSSGQIFGHSNLKFGKKSMADIYSLLFFFGPYNIPTYTNPGVYYASSTNESLFTVFDMKDELLEGLESKDKELFDIISNLKSAESSILMRFKLIPTYED